MKKLPWSIPYADDVVLVADNWMEMEEVLKSWRDTIRNQWFKNKQIQDNRCT